LARYFVSQKTSLLTAELSRLGLCRTIVPTLFHPQYVDGQHALARSNDPDGFIRALEFAGRGCAAIDRAGRFVLYRAFS